MRKPASNPALPKGMQPKTVPPSKTARGPVKKPTAASAKPMTPGSTPGAGRSSAKNTMNAMSVPVTEGGSASVRTEKIENGFLAHHSTSDGQGNYKSKTVFHPKMPTIAIQAQTDMPMKGRK